MGRRSSSEVAEKILDVLSSNQGRNLSIQEISKEAGVTWDSTKRHIELFTRVGILRESSFDGKTVYQKIRPFEPDTLFSIPLSEEDKETIRKIYATINSVWKSINNKPMTKTLAQKIAVDVVEKKYNTIPRGWYLYGELLLLPFELNKNYGNALSKKEDIDCVKEVCKEYLEYCDRSYKIRQHQYKKRNKQLYLIKDMLYFQLSFLDFKDISKKNQIRETINKFAVLCERKESNSTILAIVDDFCSGTLSIFRNADDIMIEKSRLAILESFNSVWHLIATYEFYDSLGRFYDKELLKDYFLEKIKALEDIAIESLEAIHEFESYVKIRDKETGIKLKTLMGSENELNREQKEQREKKLQTLSQLDILREFGLDDM